MEIKTINNIPEKECTGCLSCANSCGAEAIILKEDKFGFKYPKIIDDKCIECGVCYDRCPLLKKSFNHKEYICECFAAWSKNNTIRYNSTSGGIFTHIAEYVLRKNGVVVGAKYNQKNLVEHVMIASFEEINYLRQSKYIQSDVNLIYRKCKEKLEKGVLVLFTGTPCQCEGLLSFLNYRYDNLILCDFICRGVNSPMVYKLFLEEISQKFDSEITKVWFKNKEYGWQNFSTKVLLENNQEYIESRENDAFMLGYIKSYTSFYMRDSCYNCKFKGVKRNTDITLGDFWGCESILGKEFDTSLGISSVIIHSIKGKEIFNEIKDLLEIKQCHIDDIVKNNKCLIESVNLHADKEEFYNKLIENNNSFFKVIKKYKEAKGV